MINVHLPTSRFSARELSLETDVLPALSGLAHAFEASIRAKGCINRNKDDYLAGIWRDDLARGLLWYPHDSSQTSRYTQYISPTWSWASVKGQVHFPSEGSDTPSSLALLSASLEPKAGDHRGAIQAGASLSVRAKIRRLDGITNVKAERSSWYALELRSDGRLVGKGAFDLVGLNEWIMECLWIMVCLSQKPWDMRDHPTLLLLRRRHLEAAPDTFERLGVGRLDEDHLGFFSGCEPRELILI